MSAALYRKANKPQSKVINTRDLPIFPLNESLRSIRSSQKHPVESLYFNIRIIIMITRSKYTYKI